jgi:hypothetical protein
MTKIMIFVLSVIPGLDPGTSSHPLNWPATPPHAKRPDPKEAQ